ncbi:MAG: hypothetical protein LBT86_02555 [Deltaproteobacteria bacterium]|nr:hypothetical protein [Deltaproteobacteria bacterium]
MSTVIGEFFKRELDFFGLVGLFVSSALDRKSDFDVAKTLEKANSADLQAQYELARAYDAGNGVNKNK